MIVNELKNWATILKNQLVDYSGKKKSLYKIAYYSSLRGFFLGGGMLYVWIHGCVCVYVEAKCQPQDFIRNCLVCSDRISSGTQGLQIWVGWLSKDPQETFCLPRAGNHTPPHPAFMWGSDIKLCSSCLSNKHFTHWAISSAQDCKR